ncbi:MAG: lysine exporter LysO family protein [Clostridiales bacterium]|nr:lysine exporter LysO family protein [Clostridiales bacterium]
MTWYFPFVFLGLGALLGLVKLPGKALVAIEYVGNAALVVLMFAIGISVGADDTVIESIGVIGFQCAVIALCAVFFSVLLVFLLEKTLLPLDRLKNRLVDEQMGTGADAGADSEQKRSPLVWVIPACIVVGAAAGYFAVPAECLDAVNRCFLVSLAVLYVTVGIGLSQHRGVFGYMKTLGWRVALLPVAILIGSLTGGAAAGLFMGLAPHVSVLSASGMSYYSITGAFMTQAYGIKTGTYGFLVNVFREFFTVLLLPLLIKVGKGAPIAGGAAGNMDTMLVPVSKFVGVELGFVALITGTVLTFAVPVLLPVLAQLLG